MGIFLFPFSWCHYLVFFWRRLSLLFHKLFTQLQLWEKALWKLEGKNINVSEVVLTHSGIWIVLFVLWLPSSLKQLSYEKLRTGFNKYFKCYWACPTPFVSDIIKAINFSLTLSQSSLFYIHDFHAASCQYYKTLWSHYYSLHKSAEDATNVGGKI